MTFSLTQNAFNSTQQVNIEPQLVLKIDGIPYYFGALPVTTLGRFDEGHLFDDGLFFDKPIEDPYSRNWLSLESPTTNNITQQLQQDKGSISSITGFIIKLINPSRQANEIFKTGNLVADIISRRAKVYLGFKGGTFPEDFITIFSGIIDEFSSDSGSVIVSLAHPDVIKRQEFFVQVQTKLTGSITNVATSIPVEATHGFIESGDALLSYIRINDEIMLVNSLTSNSFSVTRSQLGSANSAHNAGDEVTSFYRLVGDPIDLALKLMLSDGQQSYFDGIDVFSIGIYDLLNIPNAIFFDGINIQDEHNLRIGDSIQITGSLIPANNISGTITEFGEFEGGSYIITDQTLTNELSCDGTTSFRSQYNVLNEGLGFIPDEVDIDGHIEQTYLYGATFPELDIYIKDTIEGKEFLDKEIYFPIGLYSIPRKARSSCKITAPPLSSQKTLRLNSSSVTNLAKLRVKRSVHKNFYNAVVYKFNEYELEDKFLRGKVTYSADSANRINFGTKALTIESRGLRDTANHLAYIDRQSSRFLDRYKYATEYIEGVEVLFRDGFNYEVGDIVIFGGDDVQLTDYQTGDALYKQRLFEVVNKSVNFKTGNLKFDLLSTAFSLDGRYAVISMSSFVEAQSVLTKLELKQSYYTGDYELEREKYRAYIGQQFQIRNEDYTDVQTFTLVGFDPSNNNSIIVSGIASLVGADYIIEIPDYDDSSQDNQRDFKLEYGFADPQLEVSVSVSTTQFETTEANLLFIGSIIRIHSDDYIRDSVEAKVTNIAGDLITIDTALSFTPQVGDLIELVGFLDQGLPYRII